MKAMRPVLVGFALIAALIVATGSAAYASCASQPKPSPNAFEGTVIAVEDEGRTATVVMADGSQVVVHGGSPDGSSSIDRRYAVGALYEFHPTNATSPFVDHACTATERIWGPTLATTERHEDRLPGWLPVDERAGLAGYSVLIGGAVVLLAGGGLGVVLWRRHRG